MAEGRLDPVVLVSTDPVRYDEEVAALEAATGRPVQVVRYLRDRDARGGFRPIDDALLARLNDPQAQRRPSLVKRAVRKGRRALTRLPPPVLRRIRRYAPHLPLGPLPGERGPGVTPGSLLGGLLLAGPLAPDRPIALVVAADRTAAAGTWFVVAKRPELTALFTVEAALRYISLVSRLGLDYDWHHVDASDDLSLDVPGLPQAVPRPRPVLVVTGGAEEETVAALAAATRDAGGLPVLLRPTGDQGPLIQLEEAGVTVRPADTGADSPSQRDLLPAIVANLGPCAVVLADPNAGGGDPRSGHGERPLLVRVCAGPGEDQGPLAAGTDPTVEPEAHLADVDTAARLVRDRVAQSGPAAAPPRQLLVGPANYAGQGAAWAEAVAVHVDGVAAVNVQVAKPSTAFGFSADYAVTSTVWARPAARAALAATALAPATHVLLESLRPLVGTGVPSDTADAWDFTAGLADLLAIAGSGRAAAVLLHGSECRRPGPHAERYPWSPFAAAANEADTRRLTKATDAVHQLLGRWDGPVFVSTLDLLDDVPHATWLPVVVGPDLFRPAPPVLERERPVVVHAPSSAMLKGSEHVDPLLERLEGEGLIDYRRLRGVPSAFVGDLLREADVVVDQVVLGNPGVLAAQALAAGRLVVAHLLPQVRERFPLPVPVVEANPADLETVLRDVCADRERYREQASRGAGFARELHDGRAAAAALARFLDGR